MKLHEIDWTKGKKYETGEHIFTVITLDDGIVTMQNQFGNCVEFLYGAKQLSQLDFKAVVELVDFLTAYNDCLVREGAKYKHVEFEDQFMIGDEDGVSVLCHVKYDTTVLTGMWIEVQ